MIITLCYRESAPGSDKLLPVRRAYLGELRLDEAGFGRLFFRRQFAAQAAKADVKENAEVAAALVCKSDQPAAAAAR